MRVALAAMALAVCALTVAPASAAETALPRRLQNAPVFAIDLVSDGRTREAWLEVYDEAERRWKRWDSFVITQAAGDTVTGGVSFRAPAEGGYLLRVRARDRAGNLDDRGEGPEAADLLAIYDATPPVVDVLVPSTATELAPGEPFRLDWRTLDMNPLEKESASVHISSDGGRTWRTVAAGIDDAGTLALKSPADKGEYLLRVTAWDACGNRGEGHSAAVRVRPAKAEVEGPSASHLLDLGTAAVPAAPGDKPARVSLELSAWAEDRYAEGAAALVSGRNTEAVARLGDVVSAAPGIEKAWLDLTVALARSGDTARALEVLSRAERLFPSSNLFPYNRGLTLAMAGRQGEARAAFERARHLDETHPETHWSLAVLAVDSGELAKAVFHWREIVAHAPASSPLRARAIRYLKAAEGE